MRQPASLAAITAHLDLSEPQTFRVLTNLVDEGYIDHPGRSGYRLGSRSLALAVMIGPRPALLRIVYPALLRLAGKTGHGVVMHVRSGVDRVLLLGVPGPRDSDVDPTSLFGERSPLGVGASGRAILAALSPELLAGVSRVDVSDSHLDAIRRRGYEMSFGENHPGINGVSVAVVIGEAVIGSLTIAGAEELLNEPNLARCADQLTTASKDLSRRLARILGPEASAEIDALDL
jgi:DNA-binding IclR family transcriptional regulator